MIETLDDVIEGLADKLGIYGSHGDLPADDQCKCRMCWTAQLKRRIERAIEIEKKLFQ